jgi:hypothetical protein
VAYSSTGSGRANPVKESAMNAKISKGDVVVVEKAKVSVKFPLAEQFASAISPCFGSITLAENERLDFGNEYTLELDERDRRHMTVYIVKSTMSTTTIAYFVGYLR